MIIDRVTQIKVRKLLRGLKYHDAVKYSGPIFMVGIPGRPSKFLGHDYEFHDIFYKDWDAPSAFISKSKTREKMKKIIDLLETKESNRKFILSRYTYTQLLSKHSVHSRFF
jgi:hypothetical protein